MKRNMRKRAGSGLFLMAVLSLSGCAGLFPQPEGPAFTGVATIAKGRADIYVYRPNRFTGSAIVYDVHLDAARIGGLINGSFLYKSVTPGVYHIWAETETKSEVTLKAESGYAYFIEGTMTIGVLQGRPSLRSVSWEDARDELYKLKLSTK